MTEDQARDWLLGNFPPPRIVVLERFVTRLVDESSRQNLVARSTLERVWSRHIVDSAQLVMLASGDGLWLDIGSGGGLPGLVVAILRDAPILLSEPRRKRAEFLGAVAAELGLTNVQTQATSVQEVRIRPAIVSARAVAQMNEIFAWTQTIVSRGTRYLLPRGQSWRLELEIARHSWQGSFHVEQSLTDADSGIIVAEAVRPA